MKRYIRIILPLLFMLASPVYDYSGEAKNSDSLSCWTRLQSTDNRWRFFSANKIILSIANHGNGIARLQLHCENTNESIKTEIAPGTTHNFRFEKDDNTRWRFSITSPDDHKALVAIAKPA